MPTRTVALVAAVCVTIGWLLAATLTPPVARLQSLPERPQGPAATSDQARFTEQLNLRLRDAPLPPTAGRNPFSFGTRARRAAPAPDVEPPPFDTTPAGTAPVAPAPSMAYVLAGIGVSGELRTAVLTDGQGVYVVKVNDAIAGFTIVEITDSSVTLATEAARHTLRLAQ
ncbi:MAG TPA: hypothetical protein VMO26_26085 [Vicinamibacterales bacterium]|nr:hypothetical protein [Vicinamibacterales bacterium]